MDRTVHYYEISGDQVAIHAIVTDDDGLVLSESGSPPPDGVELLDGAGVVAVIRRQLAADRAAFNDRLGRVRDVAPGIAAERDAKRATLIEGGLSPEAVDVLMPAYAPPPEPTWAPPPHAEKWLASYGLDRTQIAKLLNGV